MNSKFSWTKAMSFMNRAKTGFIVKDENDYMLFVMPDVSYSVKVKKESITDWHDLKETLMKVARSFDKEKFSMERVAEAKQSGIRDVSEIRRNAGYDAIHIHSCLENLAVTLAFTSQVGTEYMEKMFGKRERYLKEYTDIWVQSSQGNDFSRRCIFKREARGKIPGLCNFSG